MKTKKQIDEFKDFHHPFIHLDECRDSYLDLRDLCSGWRLNEKIIERDIIKPFMFEFVQFGGLVTNEYGSLRLNANQSVLLIGFIKHLRMFVWRDDLDVLLTAIDHAFVFVNGLSPDANSLYEYAHVSVLLSKKRALFQKGLDDLAMFPDTNAQVEKSMARANKGLAKLNKQRNQVERKLFY